MKPTHLPVTSLLPAERPTQLERSPHMALRPAWVFEVGTRDATLILKALGGRLDTPDEKEAARNLGDRLTVLRESAGRDFYNPLSRHAERAAEARAADGLDPL